NKVDFSFLEFCVRDDLKPKAKNLMAILNPLKIVITNFPEQKIEKLFLDVNAESDEKREVPFAREIFIERDDFEEFPPPKFFRLFPGNEVRLMGAYFIKCNDIVKDENGKITELRCTYDPETKSGTGFSARKVKGTIHWVACETAVKFAANLYDTLLLDETKSAPDDQNHPEEISSPKKNPNSLITLENCFAEPSLKKIRFFEPMQFVRNGYFCLDTKNSAPEKIVVNRTVSLKSSF
ncbi:MAG: glutamine--tRNA ligase, partial [Defluviitaleaceae bacterium]|nr:glutamine--tRNA ligase [Defluviitaleaceae bacterium]